MDVQPFRSTRPLLTVAMILLITAVTSCSSSSTTRTTAGGVSSTPGATPSAARVTALGQRDVNSLSLRAKQYLNAAAKQYLTPVPNQSGNPTWSVSSSQVASPESGQVPFSLFSPVQGGGNSNRLVARACGTTWTTLMHAGFSTRSPFVTAELRGDGEESSDPDLQIGEWDAVAPPAAVTALTQVATTCGSRLWFGSVEFTSSAQSVQVLGSPAVAIQSMPNHRELLNSLFAFSGTRMLIVSSHGWADGAPDKPPLPNDVLTQLASALLRP